MLGNSEWYGALQIAENLPQIVTILLLPVLLRFGKRNLVLAGALLAIAANLMLAVMPDNSTMALASCVLRGVGKAPFFGFIFTMTADVVNYGHWKTGIRVESMIFSSKTAGQKFGGGVAGWLVGCLMDASGFTGPCAGDTLSGGNGQGLIYLREYPCMGCDCSPDVAVPAGSGI